MDFMFHNKNKTSVEINVCISKPVIKDLYCVLWCSAKIYLHARTSNSLHKVCKCLLLNYYSTCMSM